MTVKGLSVTEEHFTHCSGTVQKAEGSICKESRESLTQGVSLPLPVISQGQFAEDDPVVVS